MAKNKLLVLFLIFIVQSTFAQPKYRYRTLLKNGLVEQITIYKNDTIELYTFVGLGTHIYYNYKQKEDTLFIIHSENTFIHKIILNKNKNKIQIYEAENSNKYYTAYKDNLWIKFRNFMYGLFHLNNRFEL